MPCRASVDSLSRSANPVKVWPVFGQEKTPPFGGAFGPGGLVPRCVGDAGPGGTLVYIGSISHAPGPVKHVCDQIGSVRIFDTFRRFSASTLALNKIGVLLSEWVEARAVGLDEVVHGSYFFFWLVLENTGDMEYPACFTVNPQSVRPPWTCL